jgi:predicted phosphoribosyltransferase
VEPELVAESELSLMELVSEPEDWSVLKEAEFNESRELEEESDESEEPDAKEADESHGVCVVDTRVATGATVVTVGTSSVAAAKAENSATVTKSFCMVSSWHTQGLYLQLQFT